MARLIVLGDHTRLDKPQDSSERVISPSQRPVPDNTQHSYQTSMTPAGFEPTIPVSEWPQTYALDRATSRIGEIQDFKI